jgi:hypothetical protein
MKAPDGSIHYCALETPAGKYVGRSVLTIHGHHDSSESYMDCSKEFDTVDEAIADAEAELFARAKAGERK